MRDKGVDHDGPDVDGPDDSAPVPVQAPAAARFTERSARTRRAILEAARAQFASKGYEKTTMRSIAGDAGVTAAMVVRYFGNKADLFAASTHAGFVTVDPGAVSPEHFGVHFARAALEPWEQGRNGAMAALHRAALTHSDAALAIQRLVDNQLAPALRAVIPGDPDVDHKVALVHSQGLGVIVGRYLLRLEPLASMDYEVLVAAIGDNIQRILDRSPGNVTDPGASVTT